MDSEVSENEKFNKQVDQNIGSRTCNFNPIIIGARAPRLLTGRRPSLTTADIFISHNRRGVMRRAGQYIVEYA